MSNLDKRETVCQAIVNMTSHAARSMAHVQGYRLYYVGYDTHDIAVPQYLRADKQNIFIRVRSNGDEHIVIEAK